MEWFRGYTKPKSMTKMKMNVLKIAVIGLLAAAIAAVPTRTLAQERKDKPTAEKKDAPKGGKRHNTPPINGKLAALDKQAKTITIGQTTIQITAETKIMKAGKEATLDDAVVGEPAMAVGKKDEKGKFVSKLVRFGPKLEDAAKTGGQREGKGKGKKGKKSE